MCGVVSIIYANDNKNIGNEACFLLKKLEYRGYDSTGASFINTDGEINLMKKVGAPSVVTEELEIGKRSGQKFIGQVRWATYGSVTDENAQPHEVQCHTHMVGAHNGNLSNTDTLKEFLVENGHNVKSDNDGEMLVHLIEHFYAKLLAKKKTNTTEEKVAFLKEAIHQAEKKAVGSYAACITAPDIPGIFAIKSGSSLYAGKGKDANGEFIVVSSDLTSILSKTRFLIPLIEGESLYFTHDDYVVFSLCDGTEKKPGLKRSRLNIQDIALQPRFDYYMEQEIYTSPANLDILMKYYLVEEDENTIHQIFESDYKNHRTLLYDFVKLYDVFDQKELIQSFKAIMENPVFEKLYQAILNTKLESLKNAKSIGFTSEDTTLLNELLGFGEEYFMKLFVMDLMIIWKKKRTILKYKKQTIEVFKKAKAEGTRVYIVASGTSYHAALTAAAFFNNIEGFSVIVANPGMFRSFYLASVKEHDVLIGVSQSGETKDLVDIFIDIRASYGKNIKLISIVNNENSTIPQEKSDFYLPILCGAEIAVAATKSFISQIALFKLIALSMSHSDEDVKNKMGKIKHYMDFTLKNVEEDITEVVLKLFLKPSMHILGTSLIGIAKEGALKIREVVLNHTEGYDSAEFKHGPNTILGKNTIYSFNDLEKLHTNILSYFIDLKLSEFKNIEQLNSFVSLLRNFKFSDYGTEILKGNYESDAEQAVYKKAYESYAEQVNIEDYFSNYPLIFICPPDERDKRTTITQIHTHKIRGADIILIAEEDEDLRKAIEGKPSGQENYFNKYIRIPKTGDKFIFVFQATLALQLLALNMSIVKRKYLNKNKVENHGIHPDVPKNVSKSITVD
ncbi:MAG: SIS domain-containing protein [Salinivirgaceae bacterium]|nr:SIS domain-containing protein [Salinivirgaceae bacterium]